MSVMMGQHSARGYQTRLAVFYIAMGLGLFTLCVRLAYLQLHKGRSYYLFSKENSFKTVRIPAPRGMIFDRRGRLMVDNRPSFDAMLWYEYLQDRDKTLEQVRRILSLSPEELAKKLEEARKLPRFQPMVLKKDIPWEEMVQIQALHLDYPALDAAVYPRRRYLFGTFSSHLLGYMGEINDWELQAYRKNFPERRYVLGDYVGKYGVEDAYEGVLRGRDGGRQIVVDASGREIKQSNLPYRLQDEPGTPGNNMYLTIDLELQKEAENAFQDRPGALVAMDPRSGEIYAMISMPNFDPDRFAGVIPPEEWAKIVADPFHPLEDKAIRGQYAPGSTYKIITAIAALEEGVLKTDDAVYCSGSYRFGRRTFRDWIKTGHGHTDLHKAIVQSCDVYFYQAGEKLGPDALAKYARRFGLGAPTGIGINEEKPGLIPDTAWKQKVKNQPWIGGETLNQAIGQGYNLVTPLQNANLISAIASNGRLLKPYVLKAVSDYTGKILQEGKPVLQNELNDLEDSIAVVKAGLLGVVNEEGGTAYWSARLKDIKVAGKTGTAQVVQLEKNLAARSHEYWLRDHAWFVAYADADAPEIAVSIIVEHAGHGGSVAAPIARRIIQKYYDLKKAYVETDTQEHVSAH